MVTPIHSSPLSPELSACGIDYPSLLCNAAHSLQRVHLVWQKYIQGKKYANPDNWLGLAIGRLTKYSLGTEWLVKLAAAPFFVTARFLDFFEQEDRLLSSYNHWKDAIKGTYTNSYYCPLEPASKLNTFISRYRITQIKQSCANKITHIQAIYFATIDLLVQSFTLVMRFMDVLELFTLDQQKMEHHLEKSLNEGGIDVPRVLNALCNNRQHFLVRLEKLEETFNQHIFTHTSPFDSHKLTDFSKSLFNKMETGLKFYKVTSDTAGKQIIFLFKSLLTDLSRSAHRYFDLEYNPIIEDFGAAPTPLIGPLSPPKELVKVKATSKNKTESSSAESKFDPINFSPAPRTVNTPQQVKPQPIKGDKPPIFKVCKSQPSTLSTL